MIKTVKEEKPEENQVRCKQCGTLLEYDPNKDTKIHIKELSFDDLLKSYDFYITCPVCKNNIIV